jgi:hypothetical protein
MQTVGESWQICTAINYLTNSPRLQTHESMVTFPSLPKMRLSEFLVSFKPTTNGFCVVPAMYSEALLLLQRLR